MKQYLLLLVSLMSLSTVWGQSEKINIKRGCQFDGEPRKFGEVEVFGFASTEEAEEIVNRILAEVGSNVRQAKFIIRSSSVDNAEAIVDSNRRVILYNPDFMLRVNNIGDWAATSILAHEIGHHFLGHTLETEGSRPTEELDADEWSGFILCRLGANLDQAQAAIKSLVKEVPRGNTHPPRAARVAAIANGFARAKCKAGGNPDVNKPDPVKPVVVTDPNETNYQSFKNQGDNLYNQSKWRSAKTNYDDALSYKPNDSYCKGKIRECETQIALADKKAEEEEIRSLYTQNKTEGDKYYSESKWQQAKESYKKALNYAAGDSYCTQRITICNEKLSEKPKPPGPTDQPDFVSMVNVQGGTFTMGCTSEQGDDCYDWEKPSHSVTVGNYWIGKYEVTQAEWRSIMGSNPSNFSGCDNCPVEQVSWEDIQDFLRTLNQKYPGRNYRLPTEAEWEYAARGGNKKDGTKYAGSSSMDNSGWYSANSGSKTHPVGGKSANGLGIYDMSGNVWEWCSDWYGSYSSGSQTNPTGATNGSSRVYRGGSWPDDARNSRTSYRSYNSPTLRYYNLGFRLSRTE